MDLRRLLSPRPELTRSPLGAVLLGAYVLLYLSWQAFHWLPGKQELGQLFLVPVDAIALYAAWRAMRRCPGCRPVRAFWRLMTLAIAAETIADVLLSYNDVHYAQAPFPTLADPFFLAYFVLLFLALLRVPVAPVSRARRLRTLLDGATIVIGGGAVVWYFVLGPTALSGADSALAKGVSLAYPLGDLILLAGLAGVLLRRSTRVLRTPLLLITAAIACSIVADVVYGSGVLHGTYTGGDPVDTLYVLAFALFALAAGAQRPVLTRQTDTREADFARPAAGASWLPYLGLAVGFGLVLCVEAGDTFFPYFSLLLIVVVLAVIVAVRQWVVQRELLRLQDALHESERRFRAIFDNAAVGITYTDVEGPRILDVNSAFAEMVGYRPEQLRGEDYRLIAHPDDLAADAELERSTRSGEAGQMQREQRYVRADGTIRWAKLTLSVVPDETGVPRHAVGIFEDITRRREAERVKDEFLSVVGHELRTPLTSIRGSLGLLESGVLDGRPDEEREMLAMAISNSDRLARLVNDILDVERMQAGRLVLETEPVTAAALVESSLEVLQGTADRAGVTLRVQLDSVTVAGDADRVVQTLVNLVGNAIKFTPRGGRVTISARRDGDHARFAVRDTGRGIPADRLESIFERFNQVDASDAREKGGTGLGLAVSRGIVEQHGGRIWAESTLGEGTRFLFTLPLAERAATTDTALTEVNA